MVITVMYITATMAVVHSTQGCISKALAIPVRNITSIQATRVFRVYFIRYFILFPG